LTFAAARDPRGWHFSIDLTLDCDGRVPSREKFAEISSRYDWGIVVSRFVSFLPVGIAFLVFCVGLVLTLLPSDQTGFQSGTKLIPVPGQDMDLGRLSGGTSVTVDFALRNDAKVQIEIQSVQTSCGCTTVAAKFPLAILPGDSLDLPFQWQPSPKGGKQKQTVVIHYVENGIERLGLVTIRGIVDATVGSQPNRPNRRV